MTKMMPRKLHIGAIRTQRLATLVAEVDGSSNPPKDAAFGRDHDISIYGGESQCLGRSDRLDETPNHYAWLLLEELDQYSSTTTLNSKNRILLAGDGLIISTHRR
jgi:hypothetical protein